MTAELGSFNWYLDRSGGFVTHLAEAVCRADRGNKERLRLAYPQVVAAWETEDWNIAPGGFFPSYDATIRE